MTTIYHRSLAAHIANATEPVPLTKPVYRPSALVYLYSLAAWVGLAGLLYIILAGVLHVIR